MGPTPPLWLMLPLSLWLGIRFVLPAADMAGDWAFAAAVVIGLLAGLGTRQSFAGWALAVGGATYIGLCLGFWVAIYRWQVPDPNHLGFRLVVLALAGAVIGDTAAYFVGSAIGRHPFFHRISPRKSVEGAVAGAGRLDPRRSDRGPVADRDQHPAGCRPRRAHGDRRAGRRPRRSRRSSARPGSRTRAR